MRVRTVPTQLYPMESGLPTVEFDEEDEENTADDACQLLLDEQENMLSPSPCRLCSLNDQEEDAL